MIDTSWSKLLTSDMGDYVMSVMDKTPSLKYHNGDHVRRIYQTALSWGVPYDVDLDAAILWHDAVYDSQPEKERRSVDLAQEVARAVPDWFVGTDLGAVGAMIMSTVTHKIGPGVNNWLIRLDLAELADPEARVINFNNIIAESCELYEIKKHTAAINTSKFMIEFVKTIEKNTTLDKDHAVFWTGVQAGCLHTVELADDIVIATLKNAVAVNPRKRKLPGMADEKN